MHTAIQPRARSAPVRRPANSGISGSDMSLGMLPCPANPKARTGCRVSETPKIPTSPASGSDGASRATAMLSGPFRVITDDGRDITPGSALRQAILAMLICAPRQMRSRKSLQDLFWGEADPARASANLRMAIYQLKRDLAVLGPDTLHADRHAVGLAEGRIVASGPRPGGPDFLEGLDLPLQGCGGFEDVLRDMRLSGGQAGTPDMTPTPAFPATGIHTGRHIALGLLPAVHAGLPRAALSLADRFVDHVVRHLWHITAIDLHDLRAPGGAITPLPIASGRGATHWLQARIERAGRRTSLRLHLTEGGTQRLLWLSDVVTLQPDRGQDIASGIADLLVDRLAARPEAAGAPDLFPVSALAALFSLDPQTILQTEAQLETMQDADPSCILRCLHAFAQIFKVHEDIGPVSGFDPGALCDMLSDMQSSDPLLPLCQSLAGYALHMLADDAETALLLIESAHERIPHLAINLDHLAVLRLIRGDLGGAAGAMQHCLRVGAFSPWRYTYEVTGAMICMAQGDVRQSLSHANQALFRKPRYLGALRYAMAGFAMAGNPAEARRIKARIGHLRPAHDLSFWAEGLLRRAPTHLGRDLVQGLRQSDIL